MPVCLRMREPRRDRRRKSVSPAWRCKVVSVAFADCGGSEGVTTLGADEAAVLAANRAFYAAFTAGDFSAMEALWSERETVACVHPGWGALESHAEVMRSWRAILRGASRPHVKIEHANATVLGDVAFVICYERLREPGGNDAGVTVATNLFAREPRGWRMVHHHAGPVAEREGSADDDDEAEHDDDDGDDPGTGGMLN